MDDEILRIAREMREAAQYGKPLARIDAEHASWPQNRAAAQRFLAALKAWDDLMVTLPETEG